MLLGEPPATQYDLHFQVAGIPVRVHPFFWLAGLILGSRAQDGQTLLIFIGALFFSILVHELGHSLTMRRFGISSHIVLHMMGGLAIPDSFGMGSQRTDSRQWILISFAGPAAGFLLAGLIVLMIFATGGVFELRPSFVRPFLFDLNLSPGPTSDLVFLVVSVMLYINIFWGLINLIPVWPLDGGQIARQILTDKDPWQGLIKSLWLSVFAGGGLAAYALIAAGDFFIAILFGMLAYQSYMAIQQAGGGGFGGGFGGGRRPW